MPRSLVVFDYDGTLVDAYSVKRESYWRAVSEVLGLGPGEHTIVDASYARTSGAHRVEQFADTAKALQRRVTVEQRDEFSRRYSAYNEQAKDQIREFPSVGPMLAALRAEYDLVLTSGLPHGDLVADAHRRGLAGFFTLIEGGNKGATLDHLRAEGREIVLFVGDTPHDEEVAAARGIRFYRVRGDEDLSQLPGVLRAGDTSGG